MEKTDIGRCDMSNDGSLGRLMLFACGVSAGSTSALITKDLQGRGSAMKTHFNAQIGE
jgi:hypothetical protein